MQIEEGARIIVEQWLQPKRESVLHFITDETKLREAAAFCAAAEACGAVPKLTVLSAEQIQQGSCIEEMRHIMSYADAIIGATNFSFITTEAVTYARKKGSRFLSLPMSTNNGASLLESEFLRMNPKKASRLGMPMLPYLRFGKEVRITTELGTDLRLSIRGRKPGIFNGMVRKPGEYDSASFEVTIAPVEGTANGIMMLDGSMGYIGLVTEVLPLTFENGWLTEIPNTLSGRRLREYIESFSDPRMYSVAELGIGLNQLSECRGASYIEDESAYGTFHFGFGRNRALGGAQDASGHFDVVTFRPDIRVDGRLIMRSGEARSMLL